MNDLVQNTADFNIFDTHAVVELTAYRQQHGTCPTPMPLTMTDAEILTALTEMVQAGDLAGIAADPTADLEGYNVDRFPASGEQPNRILVRPEAKFG